MADEQPEGFFDKMGRTASLKLAPLGGRVFAHGATAEKLERQTIELKCDWSDLSRLFSLDIVIGDEQHPVPNRFDDDDDDAKPREQENGWRLGTIPIMLSIYEIGDDWLRESAEKNGGQPVFGQFSYHPRVNTDDGVVNDKWPSCSAWIGVGQGTFRMIRDRVIDFRPFDFAVGIDVLFPAAGVDTGWIGKRIAWDGKGQLPVENAVVVWTKADWSVDFQKKQRLGPTREEEYVPPREHTEAMRASGRIEAAMKSAITPLWIIAGLLAGLLFYHH